MNPLPRNFLFGSATAAHQVEGGNYCDWTLWEKEGAKWLARRANRRTGYGQGPSPVWDEIKKAAKDPANYISGEAAGHYERYEEDIKAAAELGLNSYRFGVEWARVEPEPGKYDQQAIQHYVDVAKACRRYGQEPFVTLWHFTLPVWAAKKGYWQSREVMERFGEYARVMAEALKPDVTYFATMNEPEVWTSMGYLHGIWPPGLRTVRGFFQARADVVKAHKVAYVAVKRAAPNSQVGFCTGQTWFDPHYRSLKRATGLVDRHANEYFVDRLKGHMDWLGVQYYLKFTARRDRLSNRSDMGWGLHPEGHAAVLRRLAKYGKPLYVTESGVADAKDRHRAKYIEESLASIAEAVAGGVDCRGYFHWSLLDNFEWHEGFWPKFGLFEVDRSNMERTVRPSAHHYAKLIKAYQSGK